MGIIHTKNNESFFIFDKMQVCIFEDLEHVKKKIILPKQTHGNNIVKIENGEENLDNCDGLFTENNDIVLGVATRDCAPVCLSDGEKIGIVHIGWRGLTNDIFGKILANFDKKKLIVYVAPFFHSFEIQKDFCYEEINKKIGDKFFIEKDGKIFFNFKGALENMLPSDTIWDSRNTKDDLALPSNRRGMKYNFITTVEFYKKV